MAGTAMMLMVLGFLLKRQPEGWKNLTLIVYRVLFAKNALKSLAHFEARKRLDATLHTLFLPFLSKIVLLLLGEDPLVIRCHILVRVNRYCFRGARGTLRPRIRR